MTGVRGIDFESARRIFVEALKRRAKGDAPGALGLLRDVVSTFPDGCVGRSEGT